jgi:hypothetical protein
VRLPDVPESVSVYVPVGVPGFPGFRTFVLLPPQPATARLNKSRTARLVAVHPGVARRAKEAKTANTRVPNRDIHKKSGLEGPGRSLGEKDDGAVVLTVTVAETGLTPSGVTVAGSTLHVAPEGAPEQLRVTA